MLILTRRLYNTALDELLDHYKKTGQYLNRFAHDKMHNKQTDPELPAVLVDTTIARLHRSFANFFRRMKSTEQAGFPRFKLPNRWFSFDFRDTDNYIEGAYFKSGKACAGNIRLVLHRPLEGTFRHARIVKRRSGWYLQCICEVSAKPLPVNDRAIGIDVGLKHLIADSDGNTVPNDKHLRTMLRKLRRAQRKVARRRKGSHRRRKAVHELARLHERIASRRKDYLHKVSRKYVNQYGTIVMEDLRIRNLVKNHHLALSIHDASWGMLRHMMSYKAEDAGRTFIAVAPHYTSQKCSNCGEIVQKSLSVRTHLCPSCGYVDDRDVNAAKNILRLGTSLRAPSSSVEGFAREVSC